MSFSGKRTPLQVNVQSGLLTGQGFRINPASSTRQGVWTAAQPYSQPSTATYTQGTVTQSTVLNLLTQALPNFYNLTPATLCVQVWRNLLTIGRPVSNAAVNCPALGNCRPDTFQTTYAGWGSFRANSTVDSYGNAISGASLGLVEQIYPPPGYPDDGSKSYVYINWSSTTPTPGWPTDCTQATFSPYTLAAHYLHPYAWITGWPAANTWQAKTTGNPQVALNPVEDGDTYAAAYFPRPDLVPTQPWRSRDLNLIEYDEYFRHGFMATVARQAYYEFWSDSNGRRPNQYAEFSNSIDVYTGFTQNQNPQITSLVNSTIFLKANYSGINDLTTADFAGLNLAFKDFGNDMIRLGRAVNLADIAKFGLPSKFLLNLQQNNALTDALKLGLLYSGLTLQELNSVLEPSYTPGQDQEAKIYSGLQLVGGQDLDDIKLIINCSTTGLTTLADLINPQKMFPTSYRSLTVPEYSITAPTSKVYSFIYQGQGVNTSIRDWGDYLTGILPADLALACGAFMMSINQVKNIQQMDFQKIAQVVANLEVVNKDLLLVNSSSGTPVNTNLANSAISSTAMGSGRGGTYRACDFLGSMAGNPYNGYYDKVEELILKLQTPQLASIYSQLYTYSVSGVFTSAQIQTLIDSANSEILAIQSANPGVVAELNYWWGKIGEQLTIEQRAIALAAGQAQNIWGDAGPSSIETFTTTLENYALDTGDCNQAGILEAIANTGTITGQSIVAAMREARNAARLSNAGGELDNDIPDDVICPIPLDSSLVNGQVAGVSSTNLPGTYDCEVPPSITVLPQGGVYGVGTLDETALNISVDCKFVASITNYPSIVNVKPGWISSLGAVTLAAVNGSNYEITVAGGCFTTGIQYTFTSPPQPAGSGATAQAVVDHASGSITEVVVTDGGSSYRVAPTILLDCPPGPSRIGGPVAPGSFGGSPYTGQDPVPDNLVTGANSSYTVDQAINEVNNCAC